MKKIFLFLAFALTASVANAWIKQCDEAVVILAVEHLNPEAKMIVEKYLGNNYADDIKYLYADGPLLYGKGICQSYTQAYQWLCQRAGLWIMTCNGTGNGIAHGWNIIMPEPGVTYYMDLTWADSTGRRDLYYFMSYDTCLSTGHALDEGEWIANGK